MEEIKDPIITDQETPDQDNTPKVEAQETPENKPKKRGRPPKPPDATVIPRKGKNTETAAPKEEKGTTDLTKTAEFFARQVEGMHMMASMLTGLDLSLQTGEAQKLGEAIYLVVKEYDLEFISKYAPLLNLAATTLMVEVPVVMRATSAVNAKKQQKKETKAKANLQGPGIEPGTPLQVVTNFPGGGEFGQIVSS